MQTNKIQRPIFVVGNARSGSTLLASLLGRHPDIQATPETHFFSVSYSGFFLRRFLVKRRLEDLLRFAFDKNVRLQDLGLDRSELKSVLACEPKLDTKAVLDAIFHLVLQKSGKTRILEKTPRHIEHIDQILRWYPDAKILCTIRDPRDSIESLIAVPWTHSNAQRHAARWSWCAKKARNFERRFPNAFKIVKYEDIVLKPQETMGNISNFISEDLSCVTAGDAPDMQIIPNWEADWKTNAGQAIDPKAAYKWKKRPNGQHRVWERWTRNELVKSGYQCSSKERSKVGLAFRTLVYDATTFIRLGAQTHIFARKNNFRSRALKESAQKRPSCK